MSFGAYGGRKDIMAMFDPSIDGSLSHSGTFNNNVLTMATGIVGMDIYGESQVHELNRMGKKLRDGIENVLIEEGIFSSSLSGGDRDLIEVDTLLTLSSEEHSSNAEFISPTMPRMFITGQGSLLNVRFSGHQAQMWQGLFFHHMLEENIYLAARGYMALNLELKESDIDRFVGAAEKFVLQHRQALSG